jgi:hypothetical protein
MEKYPQKINAPYSGAFFLFLALSLISKDAFIDMTISHLTQDEREDYWTNNYHI